MVGNDRFHQVVADRFEEVIVRISHITTRSVDHRLIELFPEEFDRSAFERPINAPGELNSVLTVFEMNSLTGSA